MKPVVLAILDGMGIRKEKDGNAVLNAKLPFFNYLLETYPYSTLHASGTYVGLPEGQMGNSEVGHMNIGAGQIVYQPLELINKAIEDKSFFKNEKLLEVVEHVKEYDSKLHIMGLLSDGGVHSHINHIIALVKLAESNNVSRIYLHLFTDGRDTLFNVADVYVKQLMKEIKTAKIATISGRFYAMDRDKKWDRTEIALNVLTKKQNGAKDALSVIKKSFENKVYDEFILPTTIDNDGIIESNDGILFANFRTDRATQILAPLTNDVYKNKFNLNIDNIKLCSLMKCPDEVIGTFAFAIEPIRFPLGIYLSELSFKQLRIAETEKYPHVTFFFDGGKDILLEACDRILIPSPKVMTYDMQPKMSAEEVTNRMLTALDSDYDFILLNFANPDMVGHTGNMDAAIEALEFIDEKLNLIYDKVKEKNGTLIVTSDHGNVEHMREKDQMLTSHTTNKVYFIICNRAYQLEDGTLTNIAPTILDILNVPKPSNMNESLIKRMK
jgi:2,3-bisphosphoglycerate-independent phosphoglycerate mutase